MPLLLNALQYAECIAMFATIIDITPFLHANYINVLLTATNKLPKFNYYTNTNNCFTTIYMLLLH